MNIENIHVGLTMEHSKSIVRIEYIFLILSIFLKTPDIVQIFTDFNILMALFVDYS